MTERAKVRDGLVLGFLKYRDGFHIEVLRVDVAARRYDPGAIVEVSDGGVEFTPLNGRLEPGPIAAR